MTSPLNRPDWFAPEIQPFVLAALTIVSLIVFAAAAWPKFQALRRAAPDDRFDNPAGRLGNVLRIALGQTKLFKRALPGWMHALIFWGFCVLLLRAAQFFAIGFFPRIQIQSDLLVGFWSGYLFIKDIFVSLVTAATGVALYRRLILKPPRLTLSPEGALILILILAIMASDVFFEAAFFALHPGEGGWHSPLGFVFSGALAGISDPAALKIMHNAAYWAHVVCILFFLDLLPRSKHFHIITSFPNVYFSNAGLRASLLTRIDFADESRETFGVTKIEEFSWKKLLDLHTCTECGRCDLVCPALNSGKPLSPKQLTVDLRDHLNAAPGPDNPAGSGPSALMGGVILDETVWSCTTCGACEEECPVAIEYVSRIVDLRRGLVMTDSRFPHELTNAFKSLETNSNPWGFGRDSRADWARELNVKIWDKTNPTEYLYFVGCNGSFDNRGKKIAASVVGLLRRAGVDFSIFGNNEGCTGDPARRAGNEYLFDMLAAQNAETFKENGVTKIITHCPHCFNTLKNEYPDFGARLEVIHHSELLSQLTAAGKLPTENKSGKNVVYHDSCYLGRHNKIYDAPRNVIAAKVESGHIHEVENRRERGTCCGAGGARFLMEEKTGTRMNQNRVDELMQTNPDTIAVSCPFCLLMLEDALKAKNLAHKVNVRDISEL